MLFLINIYFEKNQDLALHLREHGLYFIAYEYIRKNNYHNALIEFFQKAIDKELNSILKIMIHFNTSNNKDKENLYYK